MRKVSKFKNAKAVIKQLKDGEWKFRYNVLSGKCLTADRGDDELWVGDGASFTDVNESNAFGLVFRHWVWWAAARGATKAANKAAIEDRTPKLYDS